MSAFQSWTCFFGRLFLGVSFVILSVLRMAHWEYALKIIRNTSLIEFGKEMMPVIMAFMILIGLVGGAFLALGYKTRLSAGVLAFLTLATAYYFEPFWNESGTQYVNHLQAFLYHLMVAGGLLMVSNFGPGKIGVERG